MVCSNNPDHTEYAIMPLSSHRFKIWLPHVFLGGTILKIISFISQKTWIHYIVQENSFHCLSPNSSHFIPKLTGLYPSWGQSSSWLNQNYSRQSLCLSSECLHELESVMCRYLICPVLLVSSKSPLFSSCVQLEIIYLKCILKALLITEVSEQSL